MPCIRYQHEKLGLGSSRIGCRGEPFKGDEVASFFV